MDTDRRRNLDLHFDVTDAAMQCLQHPLFGSKHWIGTTLNN
jgi:hypothetical protein